MDFDYKITPFVQVQDTTQTEPEGSFAPINQQGFGSQQPSILSADFENNTIDSLVKVKTKSRRIRKKKVIKAYKVQESVLLVQKDTFAFLKSSTNPQLSVFRIENYLYSVPQFKANTTLADSSLSAIAFSDTLSSVSESELHDTVGLETDTAFQASGASIEEKDTSEFAQVEAISERNQESTEIVEVDIPSDFRTEENLRGEVWLMALLVGMLFLLAFIRLQFSSKLKDYKQALFSYQQFRKIYREQNSTSLRLGIFLSLVFYLSLALIIYYTYFHFSIEMLDIGGFVTTGVIVLFILGYYTIFAIVNKILAHLFESYELVNEYLHNIFFINRLLGLILLPILIIYPYVSQEIGLFLLFGAYIVVALSYLIRWFRGIQISFTHRLPYFYMILYLCSLEIIPLMLISKLILSVG